MPTTGSSAPGDRRRSQRGPAAPPGACRVAMEPGSRTLDEGYPAWELVLLLDRGAQLGGKVGTCVLRLPESGPGLSVSAR